MNGEWTYNLSQRLSNRVRVALLRRSFAAFGDSSTLCGPLRLCGAEGISIGRGVYVGSGCWMQGRVRGCTPPPGGVAVSIGNGVSISGSTVISGVRSVVIEDRVLIARGVFICDHTHRADQSTAVMDQGITGISPVHIGYGAWLGQNAVVLPGVTIGAGAVVGANSVVREDMPERHVVAGTPARILRALG